MILTPSQGEAVNEIASLFETSTAPFKKKRCLRSSQRSGSPSPAWPNEATAVMDEMIKIVSQINGMGRDELRALCDEGALRGF